MGPWGHPESEQSHGQQVHSEAVSLHDSLGECLFKCPAGLFQHPRTAGASAVCSFHFMFEVLLTCCTKSGTKAGPLSDPVLVGNPNLGPIPLSRRWATSDALSVQVGKTSTHPENAHTMTSR